MQCTDRTQIYHLMVLQCRDQLEFIDYDPKTVLSLNPREVMSVMQSVGVYQ